MNILRREIVKYSIDLLYAYRYYEREYGPLSTMSKLSVDEVIESGYRGFSEQEIRELYTYRMEKESLMYYLFKKKGGIAKLNYPYYFAVFSEDQHNHPLEFRHGDSKCVRIPLTEFDPKTLSFTYGTSYYAFTRKDGHPTKRKLYMLSEIEDIINTYGIVPYDGDSPLCVEMQVWDDKVLRRCYESNQYFCSITNDPINMEKLKSEVAHLREIADGYNCAQIDSKLFENSMGIHGYNHSLRVWILCMKLAKLMQLSPEDTKILLICAAYHDIGRMNNLADDAHGMKSFQKVIQNNLLTSEMEQETCEIIRFIIEIHPMSDEKAKEHLGEYMLADVERTWKLYTIFKDADGLDRCRLNDLNVKLLRTKEAETIVKFAYELLKVIKIN